MVDSTKIKRYAHTMKTLLVALGLITLGLIIFVTALSPFISARVLHLLAWQFAAVCAASFLSCLVTALISPKDAWALVGPVVTGGMVIFLWEGTRHFMPVGQLSSLSWLVPVWFITGFASGALGAFMGKAFRRRR